MLQNMGFDVEKFQSFMDELKAFILKMNADLDAIRHNQDSIIRLLESQNVGSIAEIAKSHGTKIIATIPDFNTSRKVVESGK